MSTVVASPSAISQVARGISLAWSDLAANQGSDYIFAQREPAPNAWTYHLILSGFGLAIPTDNIIRGIRAEVQQFSNLSSPEQFYAAELALTLDGATLATSARAPVQIGTGALHWNQVGKSNDLWGLSSPSPDDLNSEDFGIMFATRFPGTGAGPGRVEAWKCHLTVWHQSPEELLNTSNFLLNLT